MERKSLWLEIVEQGTPWAKEANLLQLLCDELDRRFAALEARPDGRDTPEHVAMNSPRPVLLGGDVVRLAGWSHMDVLAENQGNDYWTTLGLTSRKQFVNVTRVVEVYRAGKLLWKLPEPEGGYRDE